MNKSILMIAYYFPPLGMGGVQRMAKLAKYLPQFGYDVQVLTVRPIRYPAYDFTLLEELPAEVTIHRSGSSDPARISKFLPLPIRAGSRMKTFAKEKSGRFWPDSKIGWKRPALRLARKIAADHKPVLILSSSPPITGHLVAMDLKNETGIPWVADFRDPWESRSPEKLYQSQALVEKSNLLLKEIIATADAVTAINEPIARDLGLAAVAITGGYDTDDFMSISDMPKRKTFRLCYLGTVGPLHPIEPFLEAARIACGIDAEFDSLMRLKIIGANDRDQLTKQAGAYNLVGRLEIIDYRPHLEALKAAAGAAITLISVPEGYPEILTGKIFDYLPFPAPILASVPAEGEVEKIIKACHGGVCVEPGQPRALAEAMVQLFRNHQSGIPWDKGDISRYTRSNMARRFAEVFDRIICA